MFLCFYAIFVVVDLLSSSSSSSSSSSCSSLWYETTSKQDAPEAYTAFFIYKKKKEKILMGVNSNKGIITIKEEKAVKHQLNNIELNKKKQKLNAKNKLVLSFLKPLVMTYGLFYCCSIE